MCLDGKGVEGRGWEEFNEPYLNVFQRGMRKGLKTFGGARYPSKPFIFNSSKFGKFERGGEDSNSTCI
jgi:hypothetical protein